MKVPFLTRNRRRSLLGLTLATIAAAGLAGCNEQKTVEAPAKPRAVVAQAVRFEARVPSRTLVGTVRPKIESDLGFRVSGKVAKRLVQVGDRVTLGQPLAKLDETDLALQVEQAEAEIRSARASLVQNEAEEKRQVTLRENGWSTQTTLDRQKATTEEARSRLSRGERALALASNALTYATLQADADGVVTATLMEPGQVVSAGQTAIRVARLDSREAVVSVPEALLDRVRTSKATVSLWSEPGKSYPASLRELSPAADATTRTYLARFTIDADIRSMDIGMTATVTISDPDSERIARLPLSALFNQGTGSHVFVVDPATGSLTLKPVSVVAYEAREVIVNGGVADGDLVVTLGVQKLDVAQKVRVVGGQS